MNTPNSLCQQNTDINSFYFWTLHLLDVMGNSICNNDLKIISNNRFNFKKKLKYIYIYIYTVPPNSATLNYSLICQGTKRKNVSRENYYISRRKLDYKNEVHLKVISSEILIVKFFKRNDLQFSLPLRRMRSNYVIRWDTLYIHACMHIFNLNGNN